MAVTLIGGSLSTPIDRHTFRYRITWRFTAAPLLPNGGFAAYSIAEQLRDALPPNGMIAVSPIEAADGDPFVQFTVQLGPTFPGYTLADVVKYANKLPLFSLDTFTSLQMALDVSEVEVRAANLSSAIVRAQDQVSRERAIANAEAAEITTQIGNAASAVGGAVADAGKWLLAGAVLIGIVFVIVKFRQ